MEVCSMNRFLPFAIAAAVVGVAIATISVLVVRAPESFRAKVIEAVQEHVHSAASDHVGSEEASTPTAA
jgi:hypothetical protein